MTSSRPAGCGLAGRRSVRSDLSLESTSCAERSMCSPRPSVASLRRISRPRRRRVPAGQGGATELLRRLLAQGRGRCPYVREAASSAMRRRRVRRNMRRVGALPSGGHPVSRSEALLCLDTDRGEPQPQGHPDTARSCHDHRDHGYLWASVPGRRRPRRGVIDAIFAKARTEQERNKQVR